MPTSGWYLELQEWGLKTFKQRTMLRLSAVCAATELLIAASTFAPNAPVLPEWPQFLLFPLIFVVHFSSVLRLSSDRSRRRWREQFAGLPRALLVVFYVLFFGAWLVAVMSIGSIGGQPTMTAGHYYLNDHGIMLSVSRSAYDHALVLQQRIFTLIPFAFFALGVLAHYPRHGVGAETASHR